MRSLVKDLPKKLAVLAAAVGIASAVNAQESPWYIGAGVGQGRVDYQGSSTAQTLNKIGQTPLSASEDDRETAGKVFVGYDVNEIFAVEAQYFDAGTYKFGYRLPAGANLWGKGEVHGMGVDLVGTIPLNETFALLGRVGVNYSEFEESLRPGPANAAFNVRGDEELKGSYGFGFEYNINDNWGLRAEWQRHNMDNNTVIFDNDAELVTLSAVYHFGAKRAPVAAAPAAAPAPAPAARPAPPPPAPAPAPRPVTVQLSADALFAFDRADLTPAGRTELDGFIRDLGGVQYETIVVIGYTDRLGTDSYNQALSERRATTVRDYLVAGNVSVRTIRSEGRGETMPVTTAAQCEGRTGQALRDCYQPDRRVEVEVTGVRPAGQ